MQNLLQAIPSSFYDSRCPNLNAGSNVITLYDLLAALNILLQLQHSFSEVFIFSSVNLINSQDDMMDFYDVYFLQICKSNKTMQQQRMSRKRVKILAECCWMHVSPLFYSKHIPRTKTTRIWRKMLRVHDSNLHKIVKVRLL